MSCIGFVHRSAARVVRLLLLRLRRIVHSVRRVTRPLRRLGFGVRLLLRHLVVGLGHALVRVALRCVVRGLVYGVAVGQFAVRWLTLVRKAVLGIWWANVWIAQAVAHVLLVVEIVRVT